MLIELNILLKKSQKSTRRYPQLQLKSGNHTYIYTERDTHKTQSFTFCLSLGISVQEMHNSDNGWHFTNSIYAYPYFFFTFTNRLLRLTIPN